MFRSFREREKISFFSLEREERKKNPFFCVAPFMNRVAAVQKRLYSIAPSAWLKDLFYNNVDCVTFLADIASIGFISTEDLLERLDDFVCEQGEDDEWSLEASAEASIEHDCLVGGCSQGRKIS